MAIKRNTEKSLALSSATGAAPVRRKSPSKPRIRPVTTAEPDATEVADGVSMTMDGPPATEPSRDAIAQLAYSFWAARGFQGGSETDDWLRAEQELRLGVSA